MTPGLHIIRVADVPAQPWKNGGGVTRELLTWPRVAASPASPPSADWQLRISVANIDRDGPFSAFPGVRRWFAVLLGTGVLLRFEEQTLDIRPGQEALSFDGAAAPGCQLIDGPTVDLNLMTRAGTAHMARCTGGANPLPAQGHAGVFSVSGGILTHAGDVTELPAMSLAWCDALDGSSWRFEPHDNQQPGYWISFNPEEASAA